jgi:hypothetical protein
MKQTTAKLKNVQQTLEQMKRLSIQYAGDVAPFGTMPLTEYYEVVKNIPYKFDLDRNGRLVEILQRPLYTLNGQGFGGDCDDKAICMGAWAHLNGMPFRFKAVGKRLNGKLHHVYSEILMNGEWVVCDATYPHNTLGHAMYPYKKVVTYD